MKPLRRGWSRFAAMFTGHRHERDLAEELESHIVMQAEDNVRAGMSPDEARRHAVLEFGSVEATKDGVRDQRALPALEWVLKDARYAALAFRRNPGFAASVLLTLAVGIGATTAIVNVAYAVLLKPLPYPDAGDLYSVGVVVPDRRQAGTVPIPIQSYLEWRAADTAFASMSAMRPWQGTLTGDGEPERLGGARVSASLFPMLGVALARGRGFSGEEEQPGNDRVVIISEALWDRRYGRDPAIIGRRVDVDGEGHVIVGIAPASLLVPTETQLGPRLAFAPRIDIWKPVAPTREDLSAENWNHGVLVRIKPGHDPSTGRQQLQAMLNARMRAQVPNAKIELDVQLIPLRDIYAARARLPLLLVLGASSLLLLTAWANAANLFLLRSANRAAEFATRKALGAGTSRLRAQAITEAMVLAVLGGVMGVLAASYGTQLLATVGPPEVRHLTRLSLPAVSFAFVTSLIAGVVCGVLSFRHASRERTETALRGGGRATVGGHRGALMRQGLTAAETALGAVLLISAALLVHSFANLTRVDRGYQVDQILTADVALSGGRYASGDSRTAFYRELTRAVGRRAGVLSAGAISHLPAIAGAPGAQQTVLYASDANMQDVLFQRPMALIRSVTAEYFRASGIGLRAGRYFGGIEARPAALISESLAARLWPGEPLDAVVGRRIRHGTDTTPSLLVAGVVGDVRSGAGDRDPQPMLYRPDNQWTSAAMSLVIRTAGDPSALAAAVREETQRLDPNLPVTSIRTMRDLLAESVAHRRFQMMLTALFAGIALLLGTVGTYAVVSYSVASRTREVGLRLALGAMSGELIRGLVLDGLKPSLIGFCVGGAAALAIATALQSVLFGVSPLDPLSLGIVTTTLLVTTGTACYVPARRAARMDPTAALRHE